MVFPDYFTAEDIAEFEREYADWLAQWEAERKKDFLGWLDQMDQTAV
jgi:hypothetical protein